jgi:hypothetical protein
MSLRGFATISFWADDLDATLARLLSMGATEYQPVIDPFGNVLGVMTNPHYLLEILAENRPA